MNVFSRGVRNAFRNTIRTVAITVIVGLSIGLAMAMLIAHQAVGQKIASIKADVGNTITISPAGFRGFGGTGNPLTQSQVNSISGLPNITSLTESLNDRLTASDTNLKSAISLGKLGLRFARNGAAFAFGGNANFNPANFTPPINVIGTNDPTNLNNTAGGGTFSLVSGQVFSGNSNADVALVGSSLASKNNLKVGSTFTAYGTTMTVDGIFSAGNTFSNGLMILPLATEQRLSGQTGDLTSVIANVASVTDISSVTTAIQQKLGSAVDVTNSATQAQQTIQPLQNIQSISMYSLIGAIIAGAVIILLTMIMIVRERRREIGVLKAIGASNGSVVVQFMVEAVTLTVMGAIIGVLLGAAGGNPITNTLVRNAASTSAGSGAAGRFGGGPVIRRAGGFGFGLVRNSVSNIHAIVGWGIIGYGLLAALLIAVTGSMAVAFFIAKVRPAEVMRSE